MLYIKYGILGSNLADLQFFVTPGKVRVQEQRTFPALFDKLQVWLVASFVCDTIIAATTYALVRLNSQFTKYMKLTEDTF